MLNTEPTFSLCVYCGSRPGNDARYLDAATAVGQWIGHHGGQLVDREVANPLCDELHIVANMHQRKAMMAERSHAFLALPGGIGTFEELFEVWTWRQLGYHDKPIGILNVAGYYDSMLQFLLGTVQSEFMGDWQMELVRSGEHIPQLLAHLIEAAGTSPESQALEKNI